MRDSEIFVALKTFTYVMLFYKLYGPINIEIVNALDKSID